ncbi:zonadhesin-like isoform X2 [Carica papaya]|uniref:zonadhesin-like isoform X2 n=1 Tax=Carica papaya TaxID=3649 RepID=UPI000B8C8F29|nr:zonadhesin-like isoform X2 [Carica papaya]
MVTKEKDEELALFLELRRREKEKEKEKEKNNLFLLQNTDDLGVSSLAAACPASKMMSSVQPRRTAAENFLYSENEKSDYDWLLTPPGTPLFPSLERESLKTLMSQLEVPNARPTVLKSRLANFQEELVSRGKIAPKHSTLPSGLNSSSSGTRRPSSSCGLKSASRPATPTGRATLPATTKPSRPSTPTSRATLPSTKTATPAVRSSTPTRSRARSSTPTARPSVPARSSTPTSRPSVPVRSSTPTSRSSLPAPKSTSRSATPTRRTATQSSTPTVSIPASDQSSLVSKSSPTALNKVAPSRGTSPTVKSRPWKPSEMPGFSLEAPPNLRTSVPDRPASASRGRPGASSARSSSVEAGTNGRPRRQSCSPSRGRSSVGNPSGNSSTIPSVRRAHSNNTDNVSPVVIGTKMVERVVNMRKLVPPKLDDHRSAHTAGKFSSLDSSGFGRTLSKKSLDMALRHMDIRKSISGNLRPLMTNIPASSMYSVRSGSTKSRTVSISDSPLATSSNASSEPSVNNISFCLDGSEMEDNDVGSERGNSSPTSLHGR